MRMDAIRAMVDRIGRVLRRGGGDVDVVALLETFEAVELAASRGMWDQAEWVIEDEGGQAFSIDGRVYCGTAACFAGWRALLDGAEMAQDIDGDPALTFPDGVTVPAGQVGHWARERLGLTSDQAALLFEATNTLDELRQAVVAIIEGDDAWEAWEDQWWERRASPEERLMEQLEFDLGLEPERV